MRSAFRVSVLTVALAIIASNERPAFAGASPPVTERQIQLWSDWWMSEVERVCLPTPQLLYIESPIPDAHLTKLEPVAGHLGSMATFKFVKDRPIKVKGDFDALYEDLPETIRHRALLTVTAFIPPPHTKPIDTGTNLELSFARLQLGIFVSYGLAELCGLRPPQEDRKIFSWFRNIRAPSTPRSSAFSQEQLQDANPLRVNFLKHFYEMGEDTKAFKCGRYFKWHYPFFSFDGCE